MRLPKDFHTYKIGCFIHVFEDIEIQLITTVNHITSKIRIQLSKSLMFYILGHYLLGKIKSDL